MANAQSLLNAAKKQKENGGTTQQQPQRRPIQKQMMEGAMAISSDLGSLENLYFNPNVQEEDPLNEAYEVYPNGEKRKIYDPQEDLKEMASIDLSNIGTSKMPHAILESILSDPLNIPTDAVESGNKINEMMDNKLQNRTMDILDKLESRDKQGKIGKQPVVDMSTLTENLQAPEIDYKLIAQLVEQVVDKKFAQYSKTLLTESKGQNTPTMSFMKLGDTFTFMDSANNVYECKMVYKGKGRVKQN